MTISIRSAVTLAIAVSALSLTGCIDSITGSGSSPDPVIVDPGDQDGGGEEIVIDTPRYLSIESIKVTGFPKHKDPDRRKEWDLIFPKADIYVSLKRVGNYTPGFFSKTRDNVSHTGTHSMNTAASSYDGSLPYRVPYGHHYRIHLIDDDFGSIDNIGYVNVKPRDLYGRNNARTFSKTFSRKGVKIKVTGHWIY